MVKTVDFHVFQNDVVPSEGLLQRGSAICESKSKA